MKQMNNLLGLYGGCDNDELKRIRKLPSRWVALCTTFPSMVIYEGGCYLLHSEQPEDDASEIVAPKRESGLNGPSNAAAASPHTRGEKRPRASSEEEQREERDRYSRY